MNMSQNMHACLQSSGQSRRGHRGCLDALMVDSMVAKEAIGSSP